MVVKSEGAERKVPPSRRMSRRILQEEAHIAGFKKRHIMTGDMPETLSEFAARLAVWFKEEYPMAPIIPQRSVEDAIRDTWHRRHEMIGSEL